MFDSRQCYSNIEGLTFVGDSLTMARCDVMYLARRHWKEDNTKLKITALPTVCSLLRTAKVALILVVNEQLILAAPEKRVVSTRIAPNRCSVPCTCRINSSPLHTAKPNDCDSETKET